MHGAYTSVKQKTLLLAALNCTGQQSVNIMIIEFTCILCKKFPYVPEGSDKELAYLRSVPH